MVLRTWSLGLLALSVALAPAWGQPFNKKTELTVNETILVPGKELPPGKYVMKLADSESNRHIVQIWNENEDELQAMMIALPNRQLKPKSETVLSYWETPSGSPPALRAWFYPGDTFGQEFAYPKDLAQRIADQNNASVPAYQGEQSAEDDATSLQSREVERVKPAAESAAAARSAAETDRQTAQVNNPTRDESRATSQPAAKPSPTPAPAQRSANRSNQTEAEADPALLAQNRPNPAAQPNPAPAQNRPAAQSQAAQNQLPSELPATASSLPLIVFMGVVLLAAGGLLLRRRAISQQ